MAATSPEVLRGGPTTASSRRAERARIDALTGYRGFAALAVVAVHASGQTAYPWFGLHTYGPIALFVLSGFLLFQPWSAWLLRQRSRPDLGNYAKRRLFRIFPAWLVTLLVVALIYPASRPRGAKDWLLSITLTQTASPTGLRPGLEQAWSLGTELAWYVALPALGAVAAVAVLRFGVRPMVAVGGLFVGALVITATWRYHLAQATDLGVLLTRNHWLPAFLVCFVAGAVIAHVTLTEREQPNGPHLLRRFGDRPWLVLLLVLVAGAIANSRLGGGWGWVAHTPAEQSIRFVFTTAFALVLLAGIAAPSRSTIVTRLFANRPMVAVGRWSYSLYLWHLPIREILHEHLGIPAGWTGLALWFGLLLAISLPISAASYAFVERPAVDFAKRARGPKAVAQQPS